MQDKENVDETPKKVTDINRSRTKQGVFWAIIGLPISLIALISALFVYPRKSVVRRTFIQGWAITFGIRLLFIIIYVAFMVGGAH